MAACTNLAPSCFSGCIDQRNRVLSRTAKRLKFEPCTVASKYKLIAQCLKLVNHPNHCRLMKHAARHSFLEQHRHKLIANIEVDSGSKLHNSRKLTGFQVSAVMSPSSELPETSSLKAGNLEIDLDESSWDASSLHEGEPRQLSVAEHYLHQRPHWRHWYGLYTIWDASTGVVQDTYRMERFIDEVEAPGLKIVHNNIRHKPTGQEVNGPWVFDADASRPDGIAHPASPEFRSHQGPGGDFAYHFREVPEDLGKRFRVEFFFMAPSQDTRASVLAYYDERGHATWVVCNRENDWNPQDKPSTWSSGNATAWERFPPPGTLTGVEYTLTADLVLSEVPGMWRGYELPVGKPPTEDCLAASEYKLLHLPDGLSVYFPGHVRRGMGAFYMSVHWQMDAQTIRQETVLYGADGAFESFRVAHYTL